MRFALLAYTNEAAFGKLSTPAREAQIQKFGAFVKEIEQRGVKETNARLTPSSTAKTVRAHDGQLVTGDGPYVQTNEQITGIYILNCKDMDEAIEFAEKLPASQMGTVEIRAIADA